MTALDQYNGALISMKVGGANIGFHRFSQGLKMPGSVDYFSLSYSNNPQAQVNGTQSVEASYDTSGSGGSHQESAAAIQRTCAKAD